MRRKDRGRKRRRMGTAGHGQSSPRLQVPAVVWPPPPDLPMVRAFWFPEQTQPCFSLGDSDDLSRVPDKSDGTC